MNVSRRDLLATMVGAIMISFSAVFVEWSNAEPTVSGFYRMLFGGGALLLVALARRDSWRAPAVVWVVTVCAVLFFVADLWLWHRSILKVGPGLATVLANFQVFVLAAFSVFALGEKLRPTFLLAVVLALGGLWLLVGTGWGQYTEDFKIGVWLGLATAVAYSGYLLFLRGAQRHVFAWPLVTQMAIVSLLTASLLAVLCFVEGHGVGLPSLQSAGILFTYGLVAQCLGWLLLARALARIPAALVGLILLLQPALAFCWDMLFFGRTVNLIQGVGLALALLGIYLGATAGAKRKKPQPTTDP